MTPGLVPRGGTLDKSIFDCRSRPRKEIGIRFCRRKMNEILHTFLQVCVDIRGSTAFGKECGHFCVHFSDYKHATGKSEHQVSRSTCADFEILPTGYWQCRT